MPQAGASARPPDLDAYGEPVASSTPPAPSGSRFDLRATAGDLGRVAFPGLSDLVASPGVERPPDLDAYGEPVQAEAAAAPPRSAARRYWDELRATTVGGLPALGRIAAAGANPLTAMLPDSRTAGVEMVKGLARSHWDVLKRAYEDYQQGNLPTAAGRAVLGVTPGVGPLIEAEATAASEGDYATAAGGLTGLGLTLGANKLVQKTGVPTAVPGAIRDPVNAYAESVGAKQTVGQAIQNPFMRATEHGAGYTPIGALIEYLRGKRNRRTMDAAAEGIRQGVRPGAATGMQEAGAGVEAALTARQTAQGAAANRLYDYVDRAVSDPRHSRVVVKAKGLQPEPMPMPIDMRGVRAMLGPVWDEIETFTAESQGRLADARKALGSLINGDDYMPQPTAEKHLSALKEIQRSTTGNNRRLATQAVKELQRAIDTQLQAADPQAAMALKVGRLATRTKYKTEKLIQKTFGKDPDFRNPGAKLAQMVASGDRNLPVLQRAVRDVPRAVPGIARAVVDDLLDQSGQKMRADWKNLGPKTKAILFTPAQIEMLDRYTELSARLVMSPNPSGTATTLIAAGSTGGLGAVAKTVAFNTLLVGGLVSYVLQSPTAVRLATRAYTLALKQATRGQLDAVTAAQVTSLLGTALHAAEQAPSNADDDDADQ